MHDAPQTVDVQTFLNEHRFSGFQWVIFGLCFLIVLMDGFDTAAIGFIAPSLVKEWGVTKPALGPVLSAALFGLAAGRAVVGPAGRLAGAQEAAGGGGGRVRRRLPGLVVLRARWASSPCCASSPAWAWARRCPTR